MNLARLETEIREANAEHYRSGDATDRYLLEEYHRRRVSIGLDLVRDSVVRPPEELVCLDLGCGAGRVSAQLAALGFHVVGCDVSRGALTEMPTNINRVQTDLSGMFPFRDKSVDVVFMGELVEHVFDTGKLLAEVRRVLRGDGILLVTTPNLAGWQDRLRFLCGHSPRHVDAQHEYLRLHIRPFTARSLRSAVLAAGLVPLKLRSGHAVWRFASGRRVRSRLLARFVPSLGSNLILLTTGSAR